MALIVGGVTVTGTQTLDSKKFFQISQKDKWLNQY